MTKEDIISQNLLKFTNAVLLAVKKENWYAALTVALTLPDICGKLEHPTVSTSKRYKNWFDEFMLAQYSMEMFGEKTVFVSGNDAYALRCSYLHGGEADITEQRKRELLTEFIFMAPESINGQYHGSHNIKVDSRLVLRVDLYCIDICNAVNQWILKNKSNERIQKSVLKMIEIPNGRISIDGVSIR